jgi:hypothetical protein
MTGQTYAMHFAGLPALTLNQAWAGRHAPGRDPATARNEGRLCPPR